jgi:hypothetical protein
VGRLGIHGNDCLVAVMCMNMGLRIELINEHEGPMAQLAGKEEEVGGRASERNVAAYIQAENQLSPLARRWSAPHRRPQRVLCCEPVEMNGR